MLTCYIVLLPKLICERFDDNSDVIWEINTFHPKLLTFLTNKTI